VEKGWGPEATKVSSEIGVVVKEISSTDRERRGGGQKLRRGCGEGVRAEPTSGKLTAFEFARLLVRGQTLENGVGEKEFGEEDGGFWWVA